MTKEFFDGKFRLIPKNQKIYSEADIGYEVYNFYDEDTLISIAFVPNDEVAKMYFNTMKKISCWRKFD
jgi:hypothetical protein